MEMALTKRAAEYFMDRERVIRHIDNLILIGFCVLVIFLPIAHTETVRGFAFGIPAGLWIIKMLLIRPIHHRRNSFYCYCSGPEIQFSGIRRRVG